MSFSFLETRYKRVMVAGSSSGVVKNQSDTIGNGFQRKVGKSLKGSNRKW